MWLFLAGLAVGLCAAAYAYYRCRAQRQELRRLNEEIDQILHGNTHLELSRFREGDINVLRDEIYKMTVRLREQTERLLEDKCNLADALADISHQIRTPLTSLNLMNARLMGGGLTGEERQRICLDMRKMLERIEWLVTSLLKMSKLEADAITFNIEEIRMEEFAGAALEPFRIQAEIRDIQMETEGEANVSFWGDRAWTLEAVGNIIKNCMEYTPEGGSILVAWEENPLYVQLAVKDSGPGIAPEDLPHLFERFYRGKNAGEGSFGIGLSLAQMIISRENGVIRAENVPEGGSRFTVRFYKSTV